MKTLFDTNILIDHVNGVAAALEETTPSFLNSFLVIPLTNPIAERAVKLRRERQMKLPDAIVLATSLENGLMLVSRNTEDFGVDLPGVRHPYRI